MLKTMNEIGLYNDYQIIYYKSLTIIADKLYAMI